MSAAEVQKFTTNPLGYVKTTCINLQTKGGVPTTAFNPNLAYDSLYFDLVPWSSSLFGSASQVMLEPQVAAGAGLMAGYYAPYLAFGTITSNNLALQPLDNIPKANPPRKFIFTGGQNGCSLLLLRGTAVDTVCALHYPNSEGKKQGYPLLERIGRTTADVLLSIDFDLYGDERQPNACRSSSTTTQSGSASPSHRFKARQPRLGPLLHVPERQPKDGLVQISRHHPIGNRIVTAHAQKAAGLSVCVDTSRYGASPKTRTPAFRAASTSFRSNV